MAGTIICYGDSNTYGYDPRLGSSGRYDADIRWTELLKHHMKDKVEAHGVCGRCIPHTSSQLAVVCSEVGEWIGREGKIQLWVMLGTNDLLQMPGFTAEDTAARMEVFLQRLLGERKQPGEKEKMQLRLITPPIMQYGAWVNEERLYQESRKLGAEYKHLAKRFQINFTDTTEWELPVAYDGVHLSEKGHRNFAAYLWKECQGHN